MNRDIDLAGICTIEARTDRELLCFWKPSAAYALLIVEETVFVPLLLQWSDFPIDSDDGLW